MIEGLMLALLEVITVGLVSHLVVCTSAVRWLPRHGYVTRIG